MFLKNFFKKNINLNLIRNSLNFKPSAYISPKIKKTSVSDFFFYKESDNFQSKINLKIGQWLESVSNHDKS